MLVVDLVSRCDQIVVKLSLVSLVLEFEVLKLWEVCGLVVAFKQVILCDASYLLVSLWHYL